MCRCFSLVVDASRWRVHMILCLSLADSIPNTLPCHPQTQVTGAIVITTDKPMKHNGIKLVIEGNVSLQLSARSVGIFEAFYSSVKPQPLVYYEINVCDSDTAAAGTTQIPFEFILKPLSGAQLYDTYHGVYVNIRYTASAEMARGMFSNSLKAKREFFVELAKDPEIQKQVAESPRVPFRISPESLQNVKDTSKKKIPEFVFEGYFGRTLCPISEPFEGELVITKCPVEIRSIELQLVRVESCTYNEGSTRDATEIQSIQIADGNVVRNLPIPLHMVFPRHFTCSTTITNTFKVEFEVNLIIAFTDNHMITENFPIILCR